MSAPPDPTNANAVAGPSRLPAGGSQPRVPPSPPKANATAALPPAASISSAALPQADGKARPARRADGPLIVKTVVAADGVREVPSVFEHCEVEDLITLISSMLDRLIEHNDRIPLTPNSLTRFHSRAPPNISVKDYLVRIARYTNVEPCCLLILLPYVDKVCARLNTFTVSSLTVHRFIIAAISVGSKALSDAFCTNGRYARVGGVSIVEMNLLEKEFCEALDWRLTTSGPVLHHYYTSLVKSHPKYRLSEAPLPVPPTPPPIDVPPFFSPSPADSRLPPVSPPAASSSAGLAMDLDAPAPSSISAISGHPPPVPSAAPHALNDAPVSMSTEPAPVDRRSPSSPPSPPSVSAAASAQNSGHTTTYSSSVSPSSNSTFSRSAASSASASLAPSPEPSPERSRTRGRERPPPPLTGPPLVPPSRLSSFSSSASASHLPSPARSAHPPHPPGIDGIGSAVAASQAALSPRLVQALATARPPSSPAKRGRGRSSSSTKDSTGGAGGSGAIGMDPRARFHPSPRLSAAGGGQTAAESALAGAGAGYFGTGGTAGGRM
ncbi:hypothetical protein JCM11251_006315 [Rhodosporidiobolus azoricus]